MLLLHSVFPQEPWTLFQDWGHHSSEEHLLPPPCKGLVVQLVSYWPPLTLLFVQVGEGILHPQNISAKKIQS